MTRFPKLDDPRTRLAIPHGLRWAGLRLAGDGSFGMSVGESETPVRLQVPALSILFDNGHFGRIEGLHRLKGHNQCGKIGPGASFSPLADSTPKTPCQDTLGGWLQSHRASLRRQ